MMLSGVFSDFVGAASRRDKKGQGLAIEELKKSEAVLLLPFIFNLSPLAFSLLPVVQ
ncbi:MAG: hypothetical protein U9N50_08220 [Pseudomonadota bacterium]|nr:hypothetical protein [Pseudomonadota bacterium]